MDCVFITNNCSPGSCQITTQWCMGLFDSYLYTNSAQVFLFLAFTLASLHALSVFQVFLLYIFCSRFYMVFFPLACFLEHSYVMHIFHDIVNGFDFKFSRSFWFFRLPCLYSHQQYVVDAFSRFIFAFTCYLLLLDTPLELNATG